MSYSGNSPAGSPLAASQFGPGDQRFARLDGANLASSTFKNGFTNGAFDIWQRGAAAVPDRWLVYAPNASASGLTQLVLPPGLVPTESRFGCRLSVSNNTGLGILGQKFEFVRPYAGKRICIRGWARASVPVALQGRHEQNYGTGGSAGTFTIAGSAQVGTTFAPFAIMVDVPAQKTVIGLGEQSLAGLYFTTAGTWTLDLVDMELREVIPGFADQLGPFERVPFDVDFLRCQRFFQRHYDPPMRGTVAAATTVARAGMVLPVAMRANPTVSIGGTLYFFDGGATVPVASLQSAYGGAGRNSWEADFTITGALTVGRAACMHVNAGGNIDLNAEL